MSTDAMKLIKGKAVSTCITYCNWRIVYFCLNYPNYKLHTRGTISLTPLALQYFL